MLVGLSGIVIGGGALVSTGAFTSVQAERTVSVETTGDASALLTLEPTNKPNREYAKLTSEGVLEVTLDSEQECSDDSPRRVPGYQQRLSTGVRVH